MPYSILIADDSTLIRKAIHMALDMSRLPLGEIYTACNGKEALNVLHKEYVDLVFLDLNMPEVDGFQTLHEIRARRELRRMPVIVVSTEVNRENPVLKEKGIQDFVAKPFKPEAIYEAARRILSGKAEG